MIKSHFMLEKTSPGNNTESLQPRPQYGSITEGTSLVIDTATAASDVKMTVGIGEDVTKLDLTGTVSQPVKDG